MAKTATELAKQVLREMAAIDAIDEPSAEDNDFVQDLSETHHKTLSRYGINVYWDPEYIPEEVFFPLAGVLADVAARTYGRKIDPQEADWRLRNLRRAAGFKYNGNRVKAEYY